MKYVKMLGLAAMAAMALMALVGAGTASAKEGVLCSTAPVPATEPCTSKWAVNTVIDFSQEESTKLVDTNGNTLDTCTGSTVKGKLNANPDATGTATGTIEELTWTGCNFTTTTLAPGKLKIEAEDNLGNGDVYADARIEVTLKELFGQSCVYGVEPGVTVGTIKEGGTFTANALASRLAGVFPCPTTAKWSGAYNLTSPASTTLYVSHK